MPELISFCLGRDDKGAYGWQWLRKRYLSIDLENLPEFEEDKEEAPEFVSEEELDSYRYTHPYWSKRGITDENIIELFDLGYSPKEKMITFPVRDVQGRCVFVAKRSIRTKFFTYPSGVKKPLYGLYELKVAFDNDSFEELWVCESMIDCVLLWEFGYYAVALNGLGNQLQMKQLNELPCKTLILATDNDKAGLDARNKIKKAVHGKLIKEVHFPDDVKDIGELTDDELEHIEDWVSFGPKKILREF